MLFQCVGNAQALDNPNNEPLQLSHTASNQSGNTDGQEKKVALKTVRGGEKERERVESDVGMDQEGK